MVFILIQDSVLFSFDHHGLIFSTTFRQPDKMLRLTDENLETSLTASSTCGRKAATSSNSRTLTERMVNNGNNLHRHYWTTLLIL